MKINILDATQNMAPEGSEVLKSIMNTSTPILDLIVREAIQNSLDACAKKNVHVTVEFKTGTFKNSSLNGYFEKISSELNKRYKSSSSDFLMIRDRGTLGLTGELCKEDVKGNEPLGNLIKLIYDLHKPQDNLEAGGANGVGKTIYYRLGPGLVIYYSNILDKKTGTYQSRLAACMVENQKVSNPILPSFKTGTRRSGIAWWGEKPRGKEYTRPITDKQYIKEFLKIFGIEPYGNESGTTIIIPYLKKDLVFNNIKNIGSLDDNDVPRKLSWHSSLDAFIRVAIQRWYFPRLNNKSYPHGCMLKAIVNGQEIRTADFAPLFKYMQALYNRAAVELPENHKDCICDTLKYGEEDINLNTVFNSGSKAGFVAWCKVKSEDLGMCPPENEYSPYLYFDMDIKDETKNKPILAFCRKPGMIVSYVQDGDWLASVPAASSDEYLLSMFVLNSNNTLKADNSSLDEYARSGERGDHINWEDHPVGSENPKIVQKIQTRTATKLSSALSEKSTDNETRRISGLSNLLGKMIMPPEGFGNSPSGTGGGAGSRGGNGTFTGGGTNGSGGKSTGGGTGNGGSSGGSRRRPINISFQPTKTSYGKSTVTYVYKVCTTNKCAGCNVELKVYSEGGAMTMLEWTEEYKFKAPFALSVVEVHVTKIDNEETHMIYSTNAFETPGKKDVDLSMKSTPSKANYATSIMFNSQRAYEFELKVTLSISTRVAMPQISVS